jgi:hypothetical protein
MKLKTIILLILVLYISCNRNSSNIWKGKSQKFTQDMVKTILTLHNEYRSQIAIGNLTNSFGNFPVSSNMNQLYWSDKLARKAQLWADDCQFNHSADQYRALGGQFVGENIFVKKHAGEVNPDLIDWEGAVEAWFKEYLLFDVKRVYPFENEPKTENFSQLAWAKTQQIGCGYSASKTKEGATIQFYVCHYNPGGNVVVKEVYNDGKLCVRCGEGYSCKSDFSGLCCRDKLCTKGSLEIKSRLRK